MNRAAVLIFTAGAAVLVASTAGARASVEAGEGGALPGMGLPSLDVFADNMETLVNRYTEPAAEVAPDTAAANIRAFLGLLRYAEGTATEPDPYRVCYGYSHVIQDMREHPAITGEWSGVRLSDGMCAAAGFGPGCKSTAAGAYQLIRPTWSRARDALGLRDFSPASQDAAAVWLVQQRGALEHVKAGQLDEAVRRCRNEWASLPGNYARQGQRSMQTLAAWYQQLGGTTA